MTAHACFFDTYAAYRAALLAALDLAHQSVVLFDPDLRMTGLEAPHGIAALERFCAGATREDCVRIVVHAPDFIERDCPRLRNLLARFGHRLRVRVSPAALRHWSQPFLVVDRTHLVTRFHQDAPRGKICLDDARSAAITFAQFETLWISAQQGPTGAPLGI
jgi:hypothetical protein